MALPLWVKGLAGKWWFWVGLGVVALSIVGAMAPEEQATAPDKEQELGEAAREKAIAYFSEGMTILALEYGIRLDEDAVRSMMLENEALLADMGSGSFLLFTVADWWDSPADKGRFMKDSILENGDVPSEVVQVWADRVAAYQGAD